MASRCVSKVLRASSRALYFKPQVLVQAPEIDDGATDGGIAQSKDMSPEVQQRRFHRDFMREFHAKRQAAKLSKEEFIKFSEEFEKSKGTKLTKVPTTIEELPQSDQDWLAGKDPSHPLKYHPFVMKRAKAMLAGTWVPAVNRHEGYKNEFLQPLNDPKHWIDLIETTEFEYFDDAAAFLPKIAESRCALTPDTLKATLRAMLKCKRQSPDKVGNLPAAISDLLYDYMFCWEVKPDADCYNLWLEGCVKAGDWQYAYMVEDIMNCNNWTADPALLKQADDLAKYAWEKGYVLPPRMQGKDLADFFKIDTRGGVGAYVPLPRGESMGYELFEFYEAQKKVGTFAPSIGTPAWDQYVSEKPELKKLSPDAAMKAFLDDFSTFKDAKAPAAAQ